MGKIKIKLPGSKKDPNTAAEVELPIDMPGMSPTLIEGLNRGVRLQARKNVRANSFKRDPHTGKLIPYEEWKAQQTVNKPTESQQPDNIIEFPSLAKAASTSPGLANLLAKALGAGVGGTVGALGGGAGAAHLARHLGAGDTATALTGILGMGAGGLGGVLIGSSAANVVAPPVVTEGDPKAQASYANTGSAPAGYTADPDEDFSDEDLDKYATSKRIEIPELGLVFKNLKPRTSPEETKRLIARHEKMAAMQQPPKMPPNQLARRPVGPTLPPSPGIAPAASKAGAPPTGGVETIANKVQGAANEALDMQAKQAYVVDYIAFISFLFPEKC